MTSSGTKDQIGTIAPTIVGESPALKAALRAAERFANSRMSMLVVGDTGTGKELFAQHIHHHSGRSGRLVDVDCAALPRDLVEGLLFGRRRGAYTGAHESAGGLVEEADGGTLFLDELSSLPAAGQRKLLRVLETRRVRRLGDGNTRYIDFRLVAAAQRNLADKVRRGEFRFDLYQRIAGVVIDLPPLSERANDIVLLAEHFANHLGCTLAREIRGLLVSRPWPGNVRQLRTAIERAGHMAGDAVIDAETFIQSLQLGPPDLNGDTEPQDLLSERRELLAVCDRYDRDADRIAGALGISRATLYRRLNELGIVLRQCNGGH